MAVDNSDSLKRTLANIEAQLETITLNPRPNYSIDGESVSWESYLSSLMTMREKIVALIILAEGPTELHVQGVT